MSPRDSESFMTSLEKCEIKETKTLIVSPKPQGAGDSLTRTDPTSMPQPWKRCPTRARARMARLLLLIVPLLHRCCGVGGVQGLVARAPRPLLAPGTLPDPGLSGPPASRPRRCPWLGGSDSGRGPAGRASLGPGLPRPSVRPRAIDPHRHRPDRRHATSGWTPVPPRRDSVGASVAGLA